MELTISAIPHDEAFEFMAKAVEEKFPAVVLSHTFDFTIIAHAPLPALPSLPVPVVAVPVEGEDEDDDEDEDEDEDDDTDTDSPEPAPIPSAVLAKVRATVAAKNAAKGKGGTK